MDTNTLITPWQSPNPRLLLICLRLSFYFNASSPTVRLDSKLFIGGLNWDTTDGILSYKSSYVVLIVTCLSIICLFWSRRFEGLLLSVWQGIAAPPHPPNSPHLVTKGRCVHNHARSSGNVPGIRLLDI